MPCAVAGVNSSLTVTSSPHVAAPVSFGHCVLHCGISSWSARWLTHESEQYPRRNMRTAERIAFQATHFPLVEIDTTYRFPSTPAVARQWAERTLKGFKLDIQA